MSPQHGPESEAPVSSMPPISGVVSGMRPTAIDAAELSASAVDGHLLSGPALAAVLSWLLALTMLAVDTMKVDFALTLVIVGIQAALIVAFFMRLGWDNKVQLLFVGACASLLMLLLMAIFGDRSEYQPELDRWGATVGGRLVPPE